MSQYPKIFFILTYPQSFNSYLEISIENNEAYTNLKKIDLKSKEYNHDIFNVSIYSIDIIEDKLIRDKETNKYILNIILRQKRFLVLEQKFMGKIEFKEVKNHFIYNLTFESDGGIIKYIKETPPTSLYTMSAIDKIKSYEELLILLKSEPGDSLSNEFSKDSIEYFIKDKSFDMDCYLELLKYLHTTSRIINLLKYFNIENCVISKNINIEDYSPILEKIEENPEKYTKHSNNIEEIIKCNNNFYDLLLLYRMFYEKDKLKSLLNNQKLWKYYAQKINFNDKLYPLVAEAEEGFIKIIIEQEKLSFGLIKEIIFTSSVERLLLIMDKYLPIFKTIFKREKFHRMVRSNSQRDLNNIQNSNETPTDILRKALECKVKNIIKVRNYQIILFDEKVWNNNFKYEKIKIFYINESIFICQKYDKKFEQFKNKENNIVSNLNNKELLIYLEKDVNIYDKINYEIYNCITSKNDSYFNSTNKFNIEKINTYKPLSLFDKIQLNNLDEQFFKSWNKIKKVLFILKDIRYNMDPEFIIEKIKDMNDFENVSKLFYTKDIYNDIYNYEYEKNLIFLLSEKFISLIKKTKSYNNINIPQNTLFLINLMIKIKNKKYQKNEEIYNDNSEFMDNYNILRTNTKNNDYGIRHSFNYGNSKWGPKRKREREKKLSKKCENYGPKEYKFMKEVETIISDKNIINETYILLSSNCKHLSYKMIQLMGDYIINNKKISIIKKLNNIQEVIISYILEKTDNNIIENMLYDNMEINNYFHLLKEIEKEKIIQDYSKFKNNLKNISKILDNINNGDVKYKIIEQIFNNNNENYNKLFINKLSIILFNDKNAINRYINKITNYLSKIAQELRDNNELTDILNKFYRYKYNIYYENIKLLENVAIKLKNGNLNEFENEQTKSDLDKIHNNFPDIHKKYIMKSSSYFKHELQNKDIDETFKQVGIDFNELKILFDKNWEVKINKEKIFKFDNIIKEEGNKKGINILIEELSILMNYHGLLKTNEELSIIRDQINIYISQQENIQYLKSILNLIKDEDSFYYKEYKNKILAMIDLLSYKTENGKEKEKNLF